VAQENSAFLVRDVHEDSRVRTAGRRYESTSFLSVPIRRDNRVVGVINVTDPVGRPMLNEEDHALLELFADRVVMALDALSRFKERSREFEDVRSTFKSILDAKRYINTHNADALSLVIRDAAQRLGMTPEESATLRYTFHVYDLGLAKVGHNIINQPRELTHEDRFNVEQHTIFGTDMLRPIEFIPACARRGALPPRKLRRLGLPGKTVGRGDSAWMRAFCALRIPSARWFHTARTRSSTRWRGDRGSEAPRRVAVRSEGGGRLRCRCRETRGPLSAPSGSRTMSSTR
jgi:hypothetical protein